MFVIGSIGHATNCGGNANALAACKYLGATVAMIRGDRLAPEPLTLDAVRRVVGDDDFQLGPRSWPPDAILILEPSTPIPTDKTLVVVCATVFSNVPQPSIWNLYSSNPAHAAGYSDGSWGLLSPAEFAALDRSSFITLDSWVPQRRGADEQ